MPDHTARKKVIRKVTNTAKSSPTKSSAVKSATKVSTIKKKKK